MKHPPVTTRAGIRNTAGKILKIYNRGLQLSWLLGKENFCNHLWLSLCNFGRVNKNFNGKITETRRRNKSSWSVIASGSSLYLGGASFQQVRYFGVPNLLVLVVVSPILSILFHHESDRTVSIPRQVVFPFGPEIVKRFVKSAKEAHIHYRLDIVISVHVIRKIACNILIMSPQHRMWKL